MRDEEFKKKLSEVSEWEIPLTLDSSTVGKYVRKNKKPTEQQDVINPTYPVKLKQLKTKAVVCEDCHKVCDQGRRLEYRFIRNKQNDKFTRRHCLTCGFYDDPYTGKFNLTGTASSQKWMSFAKPVTCRYEPKITESETKTVIYEDQQNLITKKSEKLDQ